MESGLWLALTVFWIVELDLSPARLVLLGIVLEVTALVSETPTGVVSDVYSRRLSLIIAQFLRGLAFIWAFASMNFWVVLPAQALVGFGWTLRSGADTAWVTDELRGRGDIAEEDDDFLDLLLLQRHRWGMAVSLIVGPLTVVLGWWQSVQTVGIFLAMIYTVLAGWMAVAVAEDHFTPGRDRGAGFFTTFRNGVRTVRSKPRLRVLVVTVFLLFVGAEVFDRIGYVRFLDNVGIGELNRSGESLFALGILFFVGSMAGLALNYAADRYLRTGKGVVRLGVLLLAVGAGGALIAATTTAAVFISVGYILQDVVREALLPVLAGWANRDATSDVRATVHSLVGQTTSVGRISGGLVLGGVAQLVSIQASLIGGAVAFALASFSATRARSKTE